MFNGFWSNNQSLKRWSEGQLTSNEVALGGVGF